jgi:hypothetical protein
MTVNKKILIGVMHTTREPWLSIATKGQLEHWNFQSESNFKVVYFFSKASKFASNLNTYIENLRWRKGRNASYLISYILMMVCTPFKLYQPVAHSVNEFESKISALSLKINIPEFLFSEIEQLVMRDLGVMIQIPSDPGQNASSVTS